MIIIIALSTQTVLQRLVRVVSVYLVLKVLDLFVMDSHVHLILTVYLVPVSIVNVYNVQQMLKALTVMD